MTTYDLAAERRRNTFTAMALLLICGLAVGVLAAAGAL